MATIAICILETCGQVRGLLAELRRAGYAEHELAVHPPGAAGPGPSLATGDFPTWAHRRCDLELVRGARLVAVRIASRYELDLIREVCSEQGGSMLDLGSALTAEEPALAA